MWAIKDETENSCPGTRIFTPHLGEMSYLTGLSVDTIKSNMLNIAVKYAKMWQSTVVLKSATTVIADPTGLVFINYFGSSVLAQGGSGDILSGTIAGFAAQGYSPFNASVLGVTIHSLAAQIMEKEDTAWSSPISKLPGYYGKALKLIQS